MVARSNGCTLCVQRRVKVVFHCDERVPGCLRCETYGRPCPGYDRGFKFVTGKPHRTRRHKSSDRGNSPQDAGHPSGHSTAVSQALVQRPLSMECADLNVMQSLDILVTELSRPFPATSAHVISHCFAFLPSVYGRNRTLDSTIKSFAAHHIGRINGNEYAVQYAKSVYGQALYRLRASLDDPHECFSSEVFCAVLLLCLYELFANMDQADAWMKHAEALSQLVQIRGSHRYLNAFDQALLKASRGLIVMHSLFSGESCFLTSSDWQSAMKQQFSGSFSADVDLVEQFFALFTFTPSLVHELYDLKEADHASQSTIVRVADLITRALDMQARLLAWYGRFSRAMPAPHEVPSPSGDNLHPVVLWYSDENAATIFCGYYTYMLILHEILRVCGHPGEHAATVVYFRDQICRSVEFNARGLLGPYRMAFSLRVAYEVADYITKLWIESCSERLSKVYAAIRPQNLV
ncbi:putative C6 finger domain protein [Aspergillus heteromorphus CBS 117.55]|uniref:Putative C6 finger domain protein n=1 Tax=Aspergillus heteromorphus CBS 117.55 TaxID=1448321 RepID=A0A317WZP1_9EURO|nr:putative C6 finger domain protein [Aspergillus heteromorphus CBS 117.55]PWY90747.1 putative C6 finger domain protein [Aspergillus heteromorphus CBS 117.55]